MQNTYKYTTVLLQNWKCVHTHQCNITLINTTHLTSFRSWFFSHRVLIISSFMAEAVWMRSSLSSTWSSDRLCQRMRCSALTQASKRMPTTWPFSWLRLASGTAGIRKMRIFPWGPRIWEGGALCRGSGTWVRFGEGP